jgi:hypothetical protein
MTRGRPDYSADELVVRAAERKPMHLGEKAILSAVGVLVAEQNKTIAELRATIQAMEQRLATVERAPPASRLRAVGGE